ncbi:hypothetical protein L861_19800 [Litchfieldella anticariensis FP35 = DSM 16096]|uniref:Sel1 repeat family protein n=1 Tax=Litchfieldella anticariensis (strain DSM 16096 / CECT 5854 / CIP 108499 / LMG 22089 / FP35) TaxID=1121939 RepID=S2KN56_LITA3|nr:tetratricopeptide repeat protein [Halomonas anticariensis]EPC01898.1 hypothetical protein L861_19800 [Halomonas anticariensis FP35 = DSM 16096]
MKGIIQIAAGAAIWVFAIIVELAWLGLCFGSVVVGLALLIFAPWLLIAPLAAITLPGNALIFLGISNLRGGQQSYRPTSYRGRVYQGELRRTDSGQVPRALPGDVQRNESDNGGDNPRLLGSEMIKIKEDAELGCPESQYEIGTRYAKGEGVDKNPREALIWFKRAADKGHVKAQFEVGVMFAHGYGTIKKPAVAVRWFLKSADQGDDRAMFNLGYLYANGDDGVPQRGSEALKWYKSAYEAGNTKALYNLGSLFYYGQGISVDREEAFKWYRKAAELLDANAQCKVGELYEHGDGVGRDLIEAEKWYRLAAEQGNERAKAHLELLPHAEDDLDDLQVSLAEGDEVFGADLHEAQVLSVDSACDVNYSVSKDGFIVRDAETGHSVVVAYDGENYQGKAAVPELGVSVSLEPWRKGGNPFEDDGCYWVTRWVDDIDDLVQIIVRPDVPFSSLMKEVERLSEAAAHEVLNFDQVDFNYDAGSLLSVVTKQYDTGYIFVDIMNDLAVSADDIMASKPGVQMAYGYARRCAAAALYLQGLSDKESLEHAMAMFKGLQAMTGHTVEFQEDAYTDALSFMQTYSHQIARKMTRVLVMMAMQSEPPDEELNDAELFDLVIHMAYQEQQQNFM